MKLLKIILFFFVIYLIRRFLQAYRVMKEIQEANLRAQAEAQANPRGQAQGNAYSPNQAKSDAVEADFKVID